MIKRKSLAVILVAFVLSLCAALFGMKGFAGASAEVSDSLVTEITAETHADSFTISEGSLTGFTVPDSVTGYFKVVIPDSVTAIAGKAFDGSQETGATEIANGLVAVDIPSSVTEIARESFLNCQSLVEVLNESSVSGIAETGLAGALSTVTNADDVSLNTVSDANGAYLVVRNGAAASTAYTLVSYEGTATALTLPAPSTLHAACTQYNVYRGAFKAGEFTELVVPAGVTEIGESAFENCASLASVTLSEGLVRIGANAFAATKIASLNIPASVSEIRSSAFDSCTSLTSLTFATRTAELVFRHSAFANCSRLTTVTLPSACTVNQEVFGGCTSLLWVYTGTNTKFVVTNDLGQDTPNAAFFPTNTPINIVFPSKAAYDKAVTDKADTDAFKSKHADYSFYIVNVNCYVGDSTTPNVYPRLHGKSFSYVQDGATGSWNPDSNYIALPVQDASYASTVWYGERELTNKVDFAGVNALLKDDSKSEINLYCHETVAVPTFPAEPVSWVYDDKKSYDITDIKQVLEAMGCTQTFTDVQLAAMEFSVVFANEQGEVKDTPETIKENGVYSVTLSLKDGYGSWSQTIGSTATVNVNTAGFNVVLIVFLIIGALAVIVTVSTAVIRKKVQAKNKKKQLTQKEVLEKYRAVGGETTLK